MKALYVLCECQGEGRGEDVIGVFDCPDLAREKLRDYYGSYQEEKFQDIRDSGLEWILDIRIFDDMFGEVEETLVLRDFMLNEF